MARAISVDGNDRWRAVLLATAAITLVRIVVLFMSPLELYPDEAQYWLWSRTLDFGYYSKPPMIAWSIWASTATGGDAEPWIRLFSPLFHAGAALAVFGIGRRLYGEPTAVVATALYTLMPGVQLSAVVAATDAPLLFFLGVTLLAYVTLPAVAGRRRTVWAAGFGAALGLAFLSKYAAIYLIIGLAFHLAASKAARAAWTPGAILAAVLAFAIVLAPNVIWNANHHFATLQHTAENAAWGGRQLFNTKELADFIASQFGVFGPVPFAVLVGGAAVLAARRRLEPADVLLICFALPPLLIVAGQAFISRANANWSGAGYLPGAILVAAWMVRWGARRWLTAGLTIQALIAVFFLVWMVQPKTAEAMGVSNSFKRAKGWSQITRSIITRAEGEQDAGLSAIAVNDRFLYNAMAYYGRAYFADPTSPPLTVWLLESQPQNQAESTAPLTPALGRRVLAVSLEGVYRPEMERDFRHIAGPEIVSVRLDRKRKRRAELFIGEDFAAAPRDPVSGRPTPP